MFAEVRRFSTLNPSALCLALSATLLGHAIQEGNGFYNPGALNWLIAGLVMALVGIGLHRLDGISSPRSDLAFRAIIGAALAWQIYELFTSAPGIYLTRGSLLTFKIAVAIQAAILVAGLFSLARFDRLWFPALLGISLFLGGWIIYASPNPYIDVVAVHNEALKALLSGHNPYRITLPNIYGDDMSRVFYNPEAIFGDRVLIAYPYPPPSLLLAIPGYVLFGDYRYSELALLIAGAALIGYSRAGLHAKMAAALFLTTPRIWFVIEQGWTEPIAVFMLALSVYLLIRSPIPAAAATGILIVTKQYMGFGGLAAVRQVFMSPRHWFKSAVAGVVAAAAVILPFYLPGKYAFTRNVIYLQALEPFRADSLSFLSWAAANGYGHGSFLWAVGAAVIAAVVTLFATRNTPSGFAAAIAATMFIMFAFGSKAFCNYYFFVVGALCCAIAATPSVGEPETMLDSASSTTSRRTS